MSTTPANCRSTKGPRHGRLRLIRPVAFLAGLLTFVGGILPVRAESFLEITRTDSGFTIDAEEADRLELSLDVIAATLADPSLRGWDGFG